MLDYADEQSVVQTRFATTVLTWPRANVGHDSAPAVAQARAAVAAELDDDSGPAALRLPRLRLGAGVAREAALKVQEAGAAWSEAYPALEYRHGPLAAATESSVVWMLGVADDELDGRHQAHRGDHCRAGRDPQAELVLIQRVAVATAQPRGLDPDRPRYLGRSVVLAALTNRVTGYLTDPAVMPWTM